MAVETSSNNSSTSRRSARSEGVGRSAAADSERAGREAVLEACGGIPPSADDVVVVFASADHDIELLHRGAVEAAGPARVVGCSSMGSFTHAEHLPGGCVAAHLPGTAHSIGLCHLPLGERAVAAVAREAVETARSLADEPQPHSALMLLSDGLTSDQREVARGAYEVGGARIPFVGGAAADSLQWKCTYTFGEDRVLHDGILAMWLSGEQPLAVSVGHGWRPRGRPMLVTRTTGTVVWELDGRPALDVYMSELPHPVEPKDPRFFVDVLSHPIGVPNGRGRYDVRQLHAYLPEGGGLNFNTGISENSIIQVMSCDVDSLLQGAAEAAAAAAEQLSQPPRLALVFSCGSRVPLLGERISEEARVVSDQLGGVPVCGFFTFGEFARVDGSSGVHNASVAVLAM